MHERKSFETFQGVLRLAETKSQRLAEDVGLKKSRSFGQDFLTVAGKAAVYGAAAWAGGGASRWLINR